MKKPRDLVVKTLLNSDEFNALNKACGDADISHSRLLRSLALDWVARQLHRRQADEVLEGTVSGQDVATLPPNRRVNYGVAPVRLRL